MLPRAALRAARPSTFVFPPTTHFILPSSALRLCAYASKHGRRPPPPPTSTGRRPPPPGRQGPPASANTSARQTSPGTSFPKDETWKPKDSIQFAAAAASAASSSVAANAKTSVEGARPADRAAQRDSLLNESVVESQEPVAQQIDADGPVPGSARQMAHDAQAASEDIEPPESRQTAHQLPDLRQGIPSTFDFEFGGSGRKSAREEPQEEQLDLTLDATPQSRQRGERDYDASAYETSADRRRASMANWLYAMVALVSSVSGFYLARPFSNMDEIPAGLDPEKTTAWSPSAMYARVLARFGSQLGYYTEPSFPKLLPDIPDAQRQPYTLVISLEDLLIHSSWDRQNGYRVAKRPGMDYFIRYLSQYYELVVFTSTPVAMADPVLKKLDPFHFMWPLGREATKYEGGEYIKDLSYLNRPLAKTLVIDTHAAHVKNQPENSILLSKWEGDPKAPHAKDLVALIPFLEYIATMGTEDVRPVLKSFEGKHIPEEFAHREAEARKRFMAQLEQQNSSRKSGLSLGSLAGGLGLKPSPAMAGGMVLADGSSVAEGLAKGKMLSDQIREQGQKQYQHLETQIRENGAQWLKEEEDAQKEAMDAQMKDMKKGASSFFGLGGKSE